MSDAALAPAPPAPPPGRRPVRARQLLLWGLALLAAVLALIGLIALLLTTLDVDRARPWLAKRIGTALERPVALDGRLALHWQFPDDGQLAGQPRWHRIVPWPYLVAQQISIGDPRGFVPATPAPPTATIGQVRFAIDPWPLLAATIRIPSLELMQPQLRLERHADGANNWSLPASKGAMRWKVDLGQIVLSKGHAHLDDALRRANLEASIDTIDERSSAPARAGYGIAWTLHGSAGGDPVDGSGMAGAILSLQADTAPFPVKLALKAGKTQIEAEGTLTRPRALAALTLHLKISGVSMANLYAISGMVLPDTPPYVTEGTLTGTFDAQGSDWRYEKFTGKFGSSDLAGTVTFHAGAPRRKIAGTLSSETLVFADLAPLIGADSNRSKQARGASALQPANKLLPVEPFRSGRWNAMDADVNFSAAHIVRNKALPIDRLSTHIHLDNGVLALLPLDFAIAGGTLHSNVTLDGRSGAIHAKTGTTARHLQLKQLFPAFKPMDASLGELNGEAMLSANGNSVATLLGASNGEIRANVGAGTISKLLLEEMGLNVGNVVLSKVFGDKQVRLHCMVGDFAVKDGMMQARSFVIDTDEAVVGLSGSINLADEQLNLTLTPATKGPRVFTLRSPLYVRGPFAKPDVGIDKGKLALKAGSALALAAVAPLAAVVPLINPGQQQASACANAQAAARAPAAARH